MKSPSYHHHHHHRHAGKSQDADTDTDVDETRVVAERVPIGAQRATNIAVSKAHMLMLMQGPAKPPAPSGNYYSDSAATASSSTLTFPQQLLSMLLNEVHTDVIVRVVRRNHHHQPQEEEELGRIKAHRFMLSRCPALRILLDTATRDTVTLESHSLSAAQVVLQYLYTDSIDITLPINNNKNTATSPSIATSNTHVKFVAFHPRLHHDDVLILAEYLCISPLVKLLKNGRLRGSAATANATAPPANTAPVSPPSGRTSQAWVPLTHWLESLFISPLQTQCISSGSNGDTVILRPTASSTTTTATTTTTGVDQQQLSSPVGMDCRASAHRGTKDTTTNHSFFLGNRTKLTLLDFIITVITQLSLLQEVIILIQCCVGSEGEEEEEGGLKLTDTPSSWVHSPPKLSISSSGTSTLTH
jgi:hypothetical protein